MSLTIYTKSSILDVWPSTKYASDIPPVDNKKINFANNFASYIWNTFSQEYYSWWTAANGWYLS